MVNESLPAIDLFKVLAWLRNQNNHASGYGPDFPLHCEECLKERFEGFNLLKASPYEQKFCLLVLDQVLCDWGVDSKDHRYFKRNALAASKFWGDLAGLIIKYDGVDGPEFDQFSSKERRRAAYQPNSAYMRSMKLYISKCEKVLKKYSTIRLNIDPLLSASLQAVISIAISTKFITRVDSQSYDLFYFREGDAPDWQLFYATRNAWMACFSYLWDKYCDGHPNPSDLE